MSSEPTQRMVNGAARSRLLQNLDFFNGLVTERTGITDWLITRIHQSNII